jgi:trk system potassium uptake protein TrkA
MLGVTGAVMNILIVGAGEVSYHLAKRLSSEKHNITILEKDPEKARHAEEHLDAMVMVGSGSSLEDLKNADIEQADVFMGLTNLDEVNLLGCRLAQKLSIQHKIARVRNPEYTRPDYILTHEEMGVDLLIHPEREAADAVVRLIHQSIATGVVEFADGKIQLLGIRLERNSPILGRPLTELWHEYGNLPARIVAIKRKEITLIPGGNDILIAGDQIFVICEKSLIPTFVKITGKKDVTIQNIMILGGGLIGQFVAESLEDRIDIKIIEARSDKSEKIANVLKKTLVIHGDGTDIDLLAAEGIVDMDTFISVTGDDETNIICTLVASHLKVPRTIALVNRTEYLPITPTIGMDAVVSKQLLTVNAILRFIRRSSLESVTTIPGLDAEIIEIIPRKNSKIIKHPLKRMHIRPSAILGAVIRNDDVIIPTGETQIQAEDCVVIFSLPKAVADVEKLFQ